MPGHPSDSTNPLGSIHTAPAEEMYRSLATSLGGLPPEAVIPGSGTDPVLLRAARIRGYFAGLSIIDPTVL